MVILVKNGYYGYDWIGWNWPFLLELWLNHGLFMHNGGATLDTSSIFCISMASNNLFFKTIKTIQ